MTGRIQPVVATSLIEKVLHGANCKAGVSVDTERPPSRSDRQRFALLTRSYSRGVIKPVDAPWSNHTASGGIAGDWPQDLVKRRSACRASHGRIGSTSARRRPINGGPLRQVDVGPGSPRKGRSQKVRPDIRASVNYLGPAAQSALVTPPRRAGIEVPRHRRPRWTPPDTSSATVSRGGSPAHPLIKILVALAILPVRGLS